MLLSSFMAAFVFSLFGAQPLCIAGVTGADPSQRMEFKYSSSNLGPITVFNKTIYTIIEGKSDSPEYLHFVGMTFPPEDVHL